MLGCSGGYGVSFGSFSYDFLYLFGKFFLVENIHQVSKNFDFTAFDVSINQLLYLDFVFFIINTVGITLLNGMS
ncbi:hypothetical protein Barb7_01907 [Bacteroidales bacterium Barb7]|nr:hypothetical protein Barb7_01907 [Bacteroidales bacterium Barb7]